MLQKCFRPASDKAMKYLKDAWSGHSEITELFQANAPRLKKKVLLQIEVFWKKTK